MDLEQRSLLILSQQSDLAQAEDALNSPEVSLFGRKSLFPRRKPAEITFKPPIKLLNRHNPPKRFLFRPSYQGKIVLQVRESPLQRAPSVFIRNLLEEKYRYDSIRTPIVPKLVRIKHRHTRSMGQLPPTYAIK